MAQDPEQEVVYRLEGFVPPPPRTLLEVGLNGVGWVVAAAFFTLISLSAVGMGGNRDWVWAPMAVLIGLLSIAIAAGLGTRSGFDVWASERRPLLALVACFAALVLLALLQMSTFAPLTASAYYYQKAAELLGKAHAPVPALSIEAARNTLIKCLTCGAIFLAARALCRERGRARMLLYIFIGGTVLVASYGILSELSTHSCYVGSFLKKVGPYMVTDRCVMSGTFVSSNSFGSYCGMGLVAAMALLFAPRRRERGDVYRQADPDEESLLGAITGYRLTMLAICLLMLGGLLMSASRAGLAATLTTVMLLTWLLTRDMWRSNPQVARFVIWGGLVVAVVVLGIAGNAMVTKFRGSGISDRLYIWSAAWKAITVSPWLGWGLGSFASVYPIFQPETMPLANDLAHSTPLEVMVEVGIPMAFVVYAIFLIPLGMALHGALKRNPVHRYLPAAGFAIASVPMLHSTIDFSLQMPAIGYAVSAALGMGWAQSVKR